MIQELTAAGRSSQAPDFKSGVPMTALPNLKLSVRQELPEISAIYLAIASHQVLYIGQAENLRHHWQNHPRLPQLEAINQQCEVRLCWLGCAPSQLYALEARYLEYYCPSLNQTKVSEPQSGSNFEMLTLALQKLHQRVLGFGVVPATEERLTTLILAYLADRREMRLATTTLRESLQAVTRKSNSILRWTEVIRRRDGVHWFTRCNGIEIQLFPWFDKHLTHNPSLYLAMQEKRFGLSNSIPWFEYQTMGQEMRVMPYEQRMELACGSEVGQQLFSLECGAQFCPVSGVEILCLTPRQLQALLAKHSYLKEQYPQIQAIESDPIPKLEVYPSCSLV